MPDGAYGLRFGGQEACVRRENTGQSTAYDLEHRNLSKVPGALLFSTSVVFCSVYVPERPEVKDCKGRSPGGI